MAPNIPPDPEPYLQTIASTITAMEKFVIALYAGVSFYYGTAFNFINWYLMPEKTEIKWLNLSFFSKTKALDECKGLKNILNYRCLKASLIVDDAHIHKTISDMSPFSKWRYLMIVRGSRMLAPYLFHISLLVIMTMTGVLVFTIGKRILQVFDISMPGKKASSEMPETVCSSKLSVMGISQIPVISGFLIISFLFCDFTTLDKGNAVCEDTSCLFCIVKLSKTIFQDINRAESIISSYGKLKYLCTMAIMLTSIILTVMIYYLTVILFCLVSYILMDAANSTYQTGKYYIPVGRPNWNMIKTLLPNAVSK